MATPKKTPEELQAMVTKAATIIQGAKDQITEQATKIAELESEKQARDAQVEAAKALGPEIVERLIQTGRFDESKRASAIEAMADPVKVAQELGNVLSIKTDVPAVGTPEEEPGEKAASTDTHPMQTADDKYRQDVGLL